jgi:hypothetical protein
MVQKFVTMVAAMVLVLAVALPAGAGPDKAETYTATDFYTGALDANGDWKLVHCAFAKLTLMDGKANETYKCEFDDDGAVLPKKAMKWNYENSLPITGPWRWYSDVEDINGIYADPACFMYTQGFGELPGDSSWSLVITPSGHANATVKYRPPVPEHPDGTPCD